MAERLFFTGSVRIIGDPRPSGLDLRVYACVSLHDGMSLVKGTGRGCYATFATLCSEVGCDPANLSRSLKRLVEWGYLTEERQADRRRKTYRVTFECAESWQNRQQFKADQLVRIVGNQLSGNGGNLPRTEQHYSSLKGLNSLEREKLDSPEGARFAARGLGKIKEAPANVGAKLATIERDLKAGKELNRLELVEWLGEDVLAGGYGQTINGWAVRVADELIETMSTEEHAAWLSAHGLDSQIAANG